MSRLIIHIKPRIVANIGHAWTPFTGHWWLFIFAFMFQFSGLAQLTSVRFEHLSTDQGLSTATVRDIVQDQQGFIWVATTSGLNRYDGHTFITYDHDPADSTSLIDPNIKSLYVDKNNTLWVGTRSGGLDRFERSNNTFSHYAHSSDNDQTISNNYVRVITEDSAGNLWVGTAGGVNKMDRATGIFERFQMDPSNPNSLPHNTIHDVHEDSNGQLWIGTNGGLSKYNPETNDFINYRYEEGNESSLSANNIYAICETGGSLWVSNGMGLNRYNPDSDSFTRFLNDSLDLSRNRMYKLGADGDGNIWAGVWGYGISIFDLETEAFQTVVQREQDETSLRAGIASAIFKDRSDVMWVGTTAHGLNLFKPQYGGFQNVKQIIGMESIQPGPITGIIAHSSGGLWISNLNDIVEHIDQNGNVRTYDQFRKGSREFPPGNVHDIFEDSNGQLWVAASAGLYKLVAGTFQQQTIPTTENTFEDYNAFNVLQDQNRNIWVGTDFGLLKYDMDLKTYTLFDHQPDKFRSISNNTVYNLFEDSQGVLWVGTEGGLNAIYPNRSGFVRFLNEHNNSNSLSSNAINVVFEGSDGVIWVGTESGLNRMNEDRSFTRFTTNHGLLDNVIYAILEDDQQNLWINTLRSVAKFDPKTVTFKNYNTQNGLPIAEFYEHAHFKDTNGRMYFGGDNGFLSFHPNEIKLNQVTPLIAFTDFKVFNQSVMVGAGTRDDPNRILLNQTIETTQALNLSYLDYVFSIDFVALDFVTPINNQYAYMMEGFDQDWVVTSSSNRNATYTNLDPGSYTFKVKAANSDDIWNEEGIEMAIQISPPWWKTIWAYSAYVLAFLSALVGFIQWRAANLRREKKVLTKLVEEKTLDLTDKNKQLSEQAIQLKTLDQAKTRFFANISHEFRTPLTLIIGLVKKQIAKPKTPADPKDSETIHRNSQRLLQLINQLLDLSKLESGEAKLDLVETDIFLFTRQIVQLFESSFVDKEIGITLNGNELTQLPPSDGMLLVFDQEKIQKVLTNLISNAIKFTPTNGLVSIEVSTTNETVTVSVSNTGSTIPPESLPHIFDRFYQVDAASTREYEGTGIGLALVKELVELHEGTVRATSDDSITSFIVAIPRHLEANSTNQQTESTLNIDVDPNELIPTGIDEAIDKEIEDNRLEVLIVEDNQDLRVYISSILKNQYVVHQAKNGEEGLEKAIELIPDLIVSDVMMPKMDGYELCGKLKTNEHTNHIPVVLLTAKAARENKLEGLELGADDYLIKPFDEEELLLRVKNLIQIRNQLQDKFKQNLWLKPKTIEVQSSHDKFIEELKEIIETHISDDTFSVEVLGREIGMSRSQLHRKLKALTDQSATNFIRNYRLHRAADLLKGEAGNITEIAYQVGFNSQTYFSSSFQEVFECSPTEYVAQQKKN